MKVRIGIGLGVRTPLNDERFGAAIDALESLRFDSLWVSERVSGEGPDPVVAMAFAAGRTTRLKFGTSVMVLPGRNPVLVAKELASLDLLSGGRLLPAFGLGVADPHEQQAFGVARADRAAWFDEALPLIRRFWTEDSVDHEGSRFHYEGMSVLPKPAQRPPDVWLGGIAPSELRRVGRLADGWLPSFVTPADVAAGRKVIDEVADAHGRRIDPEHFGVLLSYTSGAVPDAYAEIVRRRRPDLASPDALLAVGFDGLRERIAAFVDVGFSKFVLSPLDPSVQADLPAHLVELADAVLPLQT